jgi:TetR/AcrR family transcriptional repressor of nem operon
MTTATLDRPVSETKRKLLDAAMRLMLRQGYTATTVDQVCAEAGLTKGSFFHYFKNKEQIGEAAISHFCCCQDAEQTNAEFNALKDPVDRVLGLLDFLAGKALDPNSPRACLVGNLAQELSQTNPAIRECCEQRFNHWTAEVAAMLSAAKAKHPPVVQFDPQSVATMILSLIQGSLIVAKAKRDPNVFSGNAKHARAYVENLFGLPHP